MDVLKWLFRSELCCSMTEQEILEHEKSINKLAELTKELEKSGITNADLFTAYRDAQEMYQDKCRQSEFERGFVLAARLMHQIFSK